MKTPEVSELPSGVHKECVAIVGCWTTGETPLVVVSELFVAGGPEPEEGGGLGQAQTVMV